MHSLSASFVLGYHGCDRETAESLLESHPFQASANDYDWLGSGVYFWESNPDRAMEWAHARALVAKSRMATLAEPSVVGAIIDLGFCLDLISSNGIHMVNEAHKKLAKIVRASGDKLPRNTGGNDLVLRKLDCMVLNFVHTAREQLSEKPFDTVRAVFTEGRRIYPTSGFRQKTHIQLCVRNLEAIKGVFRVPASHFSKGIR